MKQLIYSILSLTITLTFNSCSKEKINIYKGIEIYGHGGSGFESFINTTPANSFESIQKAIEVLNADGVEIDVQIDKDGKLWLYHDELLDSKTNCTGCLGDLNSSYLSTCSYIGKGKVYSLSDLIIYFSSMNPKPKISIQAQVLNRCGDYRDLGNSIYQLVNINNAYDWIQIESDAKELLKLLKDSSNKFQLFLDTDSLGQGISDCLNYGFTGLIMPNNIATVEDIQTIKASGLKIGLFGVNDQWQTKNALNKFPNQIQTDNISLINRIIFE